VAGVVESQRLFTAEDAEERREKRRESVDEWAILDRVNDAWENWNECGGKCSKYFGALTVEVIRQALMENSVPVSARDVFIRGIPIEFDLLIPRHGATCLNSILYDPEDVIAVFEIKSSGLFDYNSKNRIEKCFEKVRQRNPKIFCGYVTLSERQSFHEKNFDENEWAYPLFWYRQLKGNELYESTGAWQKLLSKIHFCVESR